MTADLECQDIRDSRLTMDRNCNTNDSECVLLVPGQQGTFRLKIGVPDKIHGEVLFLSVSLKDTVGEKSSLSNHPIDNICCIHENVNIWVKTQSNEIIVCNAYLSK